MSAQGKTPKVTALEAEIEEVILFPFFLSFFLFLRKNSNIKNQKSKNQN